MSFCENCPRKCPVERSVSLGFCRAPKDFAVGRVGLHLWEEPCLTGRNGAGAVFFAGCNLRCVYCQNKEISHTGEGTIYTESALSDAILDLQEKGAACIDLVTPTPYSHELALLLRKVKPSLTVPVVWNCGGYESVERLRELEGLVDIYLPDAKYASKTLSSAFSSAPDYPEVMTAAVREMVRQTGEPVFTKSGSLQKGTLVRHLVLPGHREDSLALLALLKNEVGSENILLSLMRQYTPDFALDCPYKELRRRVTTFEYEKVLAAANELGFAGYSQEKESASKAYTPRFNEQ